MPSSEIQASHWPLIRSLARFHIKAEPLWLDYTMMMADDNYLAVTTLC